jgi:hypothetical protein
MTGRAERIAELELHVSRHDVTAACIAGARLLNAHGTTSVQDVIARLATSGDRCENAAFARYAAQRLSQMTHPRYKKDAPALHRVVAEAIATLATHPAPPRQCTMSLKKVRKSRCGRILEKYCTDATLEHVKDVVALTDQTGAAVEALSRVRGFHIAVPVVNVAPSMVKDPLWIPWRIITEVFVLDAASSQYVADLMSLYCFRFTKTARKARLGLLKHALNVLRERKYLSGCVFAPVALEASLKIAYVHLELDGAKKEHRGSEPSAEIDIISTMLV